MTSFWKYPTDPADPEWTGDRVECTPVEGQQYQRCELLNDEGDRVAWEHVWKKTGSLEQSGECLFNEIDDFFTQNRWDTIESTLREKWKMGTDDFLFGLCQARKDNAMWMDCR